jgi:hypothetical protein
MHNKGLFKNFRRYLRKIKQIRFEGETECSNEIIESLQAEHKQIENDYTVIETEMKHMLGDKFLEKVGGAYFYGNIVPFLMRYL